MQEGTARSEASSMQSRGQSLQNEPDTHSLPGLLRARANSIDVDEVERGSLLGRGCASFFTEKNLHVFLSAWICLSHCPCLVGL